MSQEEAWREFAQSVAGKLETKETGFWIFKGREHVVQAPLGKWTLTLETFTKATGGDPQYGSGGTVTYTRMNTPFRARGGFRFRLHKNGFSSRLRRLLGAQGIEVGDPEFDRAFLLQGSDEAQVQALFSNHKILLEAVAQSKKLHRFEIKDGAAGLSELNFEERGITEDVGRLRALHDLFGKTRDQLVRIGSASPEGPEFVR